MSVLFRVMYTIFHSNSFENLIGCNCGAGWKSLFQPALQVPNIGFSKEALWKRPLHIRRKEHKNNIKLNPKYHNVISKHIFKNENNSLTHEILWNDFKVVHQEKNFQKSAFAEMVFKKIEKNNSLNKVSDLEHFNQS